mgnify:CR=1 FL=1
MALDNRKKVNEYHYDYPSEISSSSSSSHLSRLAVISAHLRDSSTPSYQGPERFHTLSDKNRESLTVVDNRTGKKYDIPISEGSTIKATDFKQVLIYYSPPYQILVFINPSRKMICIFICNLSSMGKEIFHLSRKLNVTVSVSKLSWYI